MRLCKKDKGSDFMQVFLLNTLKSILCYAFYAHYACVAKLLIPGSGTPRGAVFERLYTFVHYIQRSGRGRQGLKAGLFGL
jgi:hypothetical protein